MKPALAILFSLTLAACSFDLPQDLTCSSGETRPDHTCINNVWLRTEDPQNSNDTGTNLDGSTQPDTSGDAGCTPESNAEFCARLSATCGILTAQDNCGAERSASCGGCTDPLICGAGGTPNVCACPGSSDADVCADLGKNCGSLETLDPTCGITRTFNCGTCSAPESCGASGQDNVCGCQESDQDFCQRLNACGEITAPDACGQPKTAQCGGCSAPETCGGAGLPNQCGCTVTTACESLGLNCGDADLSNVCTNLGTESCGDCGAGTCTPANTCTCPAGYELAQDTCRDLDECALNTDTCDANALCTNTDGAFTCACKPGFSGDGQTCDASSPLIAEVETATGTGIVTTGNMTGSDSDVYFVYVSLRTSQRVVQSIQGLGLTWQLIDVECDGNDTQRLEVWGARGNAFSSPIIVTMNAPPFGAAVTALRITNVAASNSTGNIVSDNSSTSDNCDNSQASSSYTYPYSPDIGSLILTGTATAGRAHTPGTDWTEIDQATYNGAQGNNAGLATMARVGAGQNFNVSGSFSQSTHWASISLEIQGP